MRWEFDSCFFKFSIPCLKRILEKYSYLRQKAGKGAKEKKERLIARREVLRV
ncbi:hypothetical protein XIS1_650017 [Xenorhabdus innexi]|uniref:Transposase n=1 Tax=Xenorhabdus innexi TaxID=290109 RepID=A0A1N6N031_9GAMM|nr:hypothetical protein XIS1_650017 [Xenorhabdus innexi]